MVNDETGVVSPARCGRNGCWYCLPLNARRRATALQWAGVRRSITLTEVADRDEGDPYQVVRRRVKRIREILCRQGIDPGLWGVFVERGSKTGMIHAHVAQNGPSPIPKELLNDASQRAGAGFSRIEAIRRSSGFSAYVGKGFAAYVGKGFTVEDGVSNLRLNGGRLGHFSRGFFGQTANGGNIGVRAAERLAAEAMRTDEAGKWVLMRESHLSVGRAAVQEIRARQ